MRSQMITLMGAAFCCAATALASGEPPAAKTVYLDEQKLKFVETGWSEARARQSIRRTPLSVGGVKYARGVGTHAVSCAFFDLGGKAVSFSADVGVDDETRGKGTVKFIVFADGKAVAESPAMKGGDKAFRLKADLRGVKLVNLFVCDMRDGTSDDYADWLDAVFTVEEGCVIAPFAGQDDDPGILTPPVGEAPRLNGARVFGVRPGSPVLWRVAASGVRPMAFAVSALPDGLAFDAARGVFTGAIERRGDYDVTVTARNAKGETKRTLTFRVGDTLALTPPMGWNSWNCFADAVKEKDIRDAADAMVASGLADHGWTYVNIDDYWQNSSYHAKKDPTLAGPERLPDGTIGVNRRFSDMKALADYVHGKGLRIGLYSSPGPLTCGLCTGSWKYEWKDAKTYADWGYDYLKYDLCSYGKMMFGDGRAKFMAPYQLMGAALAAQKRDIVFSLCQYGLADVSSWGGTVRGNCWRTTGDIRDTWNSMYGILRNQANLWPFAGPGRWNDPDMLVVGQVGWGDRQQPTRLTRHEQYTHMSLWAMLASPLLIGCDLTKLDDFTFGLLANDEVIEVNQDELGAQAAKVQGSVLEGEVWAKPMGDGSVVLALFNPMPLSNEVKVDFDRLGLLGRWRVRDVWRQRDEGVFAHGYAVRVGRHGTKMIRLFAEEGARVDPELRDIRDNAFYSLIEIARPVGRPGAKSAGISPCGDCPRMR